MNLALGHCARTIVFHLIDADVELNMRLMTIQRVPAVTRPPPSNLCVECVQSAFPNLTQNDRVDNSDNFGIIYWVLSGIQFNNNNNQYTVDIAIFLSDSCRFTLHTHTCTRWLFDE